MLTLTFYVLIITAAIQLSQCLDMPCLIVNADHYQNIYTDSKSPHVQFSVRYRLKANDTSLWTFIPVRNSSTEYYIQNYKTGEYLLASRTIQYREGLRHVITKPVKKQSELTDSFIWMFYESKNVEVFNVLLNIKGFVTKMAIDFVQIRNKAYNEPLYAKAHGLRSILWFIDSFDTQLYTSLDKSHEHHSLDWLAFCGAHA